MSRLARKKRVGTPDGGQPLPRSSQRYFTDGINLYRFVDWLARSDSGTVAIIEDCRSLAILLVAADRLGAAGLRPV
jgi:hypothetical protein